MAAPRRMAAAWPVAPGWRRLLRLLTAVGLLILLSGGVLMPIPGTVTAAPGLGQVDPASADGVPMAGVDSGRSSANPGPAPTGQPELVWSGFAGVGAHPPIVVDGVAYVASDAGDVVAVELAGGSELWRVPLGAGTDTPTLADGVLYISLVTNSETGNSGGALLALDATSGDELWRMPTGTFGGASPVAVDGVVYAGGDQEVYAFDAASGEQIWVAALDAAPCVCNPRPVAVADGIVFAVPGGMQQASLFALDAASGAEVWRYDGQLAGDLMRFTDPVVADGRVYVGEGELMEPAGGRFIALDAATGEEAWAVELDASSPPAVADGVLYLQTRIPRHVAGMLTALDAESGELLWDTPTIDASEAAPAVAGDLILVPGGTRQGYAPGFDDVLLVGFHAGAGAEQWQVELGGSISGAPVILAGEIVVTTYGEGELFVLGSGAGAAPATPRPAIDLSGREPCPATPAGDPYTRELTGTPVPAVTAPGQGKDSVTAADMPTGEPAPDDVVAAMNATLHAVASCVGGDPALLYGLFSDDYFVRAAAVMAESGMSPNAEIAVTRLLPPFSPVADLTISDARVLADGRAAGFFAGGFNPIFAVFAEQDGAWLIDELGTVVDPGLQPALAATPVQ